MNFNRDQEENLLDRLPPEYRISSWDIVRVVAFSLLMMMVGFSLMAAVAIFHVQTAHPADSDPQVIANETLLLIQKGIQEWPLSVKILWMLAQAMVIVPVIQFLRSRGFSIRVQLRLTPVPKIFLGYAAVVGVGLTVVTDELGRLLNMVLPFPPEMMEALNQSMQITSVSDFIVIFGTVIVMAAIIEEAYFRGFLQRWFETRKDVTTGVLTASAMFALFHFNVYLLIPILVAATVMGAMAWRAESIWPSIVTHAIYNGIGLFAANTIGTDDPDWYSLGDHVAPWWVLLALIITGWALKQFFEAADQHGLGGHGPSGDSGTHLNTTA